MPQIGHSDRSVLRMLPDSMAGAADESDLSLCRPELSSVVCSASLGIESRR